jgi:hypothetical protein
MEGGASAPPPVSARRVRACVSANARGPRAHGQAMRREKPYGRTWVGASGDPLAEGSCSGSGWEPC